MHTSGHINLLRAGILLSLLLVANIGCVGERASDADEPTVGASTSHDAAADRIMQLSEEPVATLTGISEAEPFSRVAGIAASPGGLLYVLDRGAAAVMAFSPDGTLLWKTGRRGNGPGEFGDPRGLLADGSHVSVTDSRRRMVLNFDTAGRLLSEFRLFGPYLANGLATAEGVVADEWVQEAPPSPMRQRVLLLRDAEATVIAEAMVPVGETTQLEVCLGHTVPLDPRPVFTPQLIWRHRSGRTAVRGAWAEYRIDVYENATLRMSIARPLAPAVATEDLVLREIGGTTSTIRECNYDNRMVARARGWNPTIPVISGFLWAPDGDLWVGRRGPDGREVTDVFSSEGVYRNTLPLALPHAVLTTDTIAYLEQDSLGVQGIRILRIR